MSVGLESGSFLSSWFTPAQRLRSWGRAAACVTAAAVGITLGVAAEPAAAVVPPAAVKPAAPKATSRADLVSAQVTARAQGARVEVEALREATSTTWVNPDGTLTTQQHQGPIRFKDAKGGWRDVDLTMTELADGTVAPKGHVLGLSLAGAGRGAGGAAKGASETDLAVVGEKPGKDKAPRQVTLGFGGKLGKPQLDGPRATYQDVAPGVDLVLEARRTGYETLLVIKDSAALTALQGDSKGDGVVSWDIPVKTRGLTARAEKDGSVAFVAKDGTVASHLAPPVAWDAQVDQRSGNRVNESPVAVTVTQKGAGRAVLSLTPDQDWLTDPARTFPVTIDPTYASGTVTTSFDTYVSSAYPSATYSTSTELRVGTYDGGGDKYRSFLTFPLASFAGKDIKSASLSLYEFHSWSCTAKPFYLYNAYGASASTNWSNQPAAVSQYGSLTVAKGFSSSCAAGRVSVPITGLIDAWSASASSAGAVRLHASETDSYGWKKFYSLESSQDPYITYTYNRKPNLAAQPSVSGANAYTAPGSSTSMLFTNKARPTLTTVVTDPDGNAVYSNIQVHSNTTGSALVTNCVTSRAPYTASGATASCTLASDLADNTTYYLRASAGDDQGLSNGGWSSWRTLYVSRTAPPAPVITCPGFTDGAWTDTKPAGDVTCTISAAGVAGTYVAPGYIDLTVDGVKQARRTITASNDPGVAKTTWTFKPTPEGAHTITAAGVSRSLLPSSDKTLGMGWGGASLTLPKTGTTTSGTVSVDAGGPPRGGAASVTGRIQWRVAGDTAWKDGPALTVSAPDATKPVRATTTWAPKTDLDTAGVNTRRPVLLDMQYCFTYAGVPQPKCTGAQTPAALTWVPHAFGNGYPVADAGPGQVALFTGEFNTAATDVSVPGYAGDLTISRTHLSLAGDGAVATWPTDATTGVFGPGWTAALEGPEAGAAGLQVVDNTRQDGTIVLLDEEGDPLVFQNPDKTRTYKAGTAQAPVPYKPATTDTAAAALDLTVTGPVGADMVLSLKEEDGTVTTWTPVAYSIGADTEWKPAAVNEPGQVGATTYGHASDGSGKVTRIVAAVPPDGAIPPAPAVTCPTSGSLLGPAYRGCRALDLSYAPSSTTVPGEYPGQVKSISATLWNPDTAAMATTVVATYQYDSSGRLVKVTDPRTNLGTSYTWHGASTRIASVKASGLAAHHLSYDSATPPKLAAVTRDNPAGSGDPVTLARYAYGTPVSGGGLPDLTAATVNAWEQQKAPSAGYAVFGQDYTGPVTGTGVDWSYADLQYADEDGYTVNTASYGAGAWQVTSTDYDTKGNIVRELDAGAINRVRQILATDGADAAMAAADSLSTQTFYNSADIVGAVDEDGTGPGEPVTKVLTPAGTLVTDVFGPARYAKLATRDGDGDGEPDTLPVRPHTHTSYDEDAPNLGYGAGINPATQEPFRLATTITTGAADPAAAPGAPDLETNGTTTNSYAKLDAADPTEGHGWALGAPTQVTTDPGGLNITRVTRYDTEGRPTETRQPLSDGTDAGTTKTLYYTAEDHPVDTTTCGNKPEWAGLTCRTHPAAAPTAGAGGAGTLPAAHTSGYSMWLAPTSVVETSGAGTGAPTRTTQTRYDTAGRVTATWLSTANLDGSTPRSGTFTHYDTATGLVDYSGVLNAAKDDADQVARTTTTYDGWGRPTSVKNDLGDVATTTYNAAGQVATLTEDPAAEGQPTSTTVYGYDGDGLPGGKDADGNLERRGLATSLTVSRTGTGGSLQFTAAYDAEGKLVTQRLPGAVTQKSEYDEAGEPKTLTYTGQVTPVTASTDPDTGETVYTPGTPVQNQPWLAWTVVNDAQGRVRTEYTGQGAAFDGVPGVEDPTEITAPTVGQAVGYTRDYRYDAAGRLTTVVDRTASGHAADLQASPCAVRSYGFDKNGRRTGYTEAVHGDGDCDGIASVTTTTKDLDHYDTADRPTTGANGAGQYVYDAFGRQATIPAADAPDPAKGPITLGYFDDDLPRSIGQDDGNGNRTSTTFTLDSAGRRLQAETTATAGGVSTTSTLVRHYTDGGDNPSWTVTNPGTPGAVVTRFAESIGGDLGATIAADGAAELTIANPHGDVVTTVPIPATQPGATAAAGIDGWSDYTEYGTPRHPAATQPVAGLAGYGWLGAKQRSTTTETAGLTLMGVRLYNPATGRFTSVDPQLGGNENAYTYPLDPVNQYDLDGHRWSWKRAAKWAGYAALGACVLASAGVCLGVGLASAAISTYSSYRSGRRGWALAGTAAWNLGAAKFAGPSRWAKYGGRHAARGFKRWSSHYRGRHSGSSSWRSGARRAARNYKYSWQGNWALGRRRVIRRTAINLGMGYLSHRGWP